MPHCFPTRRVLVSGLLPLLFALQASGGAKADSYARLLVGGRVTVELPADWSVRDASEVSATTLIDMRGWKGRALEPAGGRVEALDALSRLDTYKAFVRVSLIPTPMFTQDDFRKVLAESQQGILNGVAANWDKERPALESEFRGSGAELLPGRTVRIQQVGENVAFAIEYRLRYAGDGSPFLVSQYHIPAGKQKVDFAVGYRELDAQAFAPIQERVKTSLTIR